MGSRTIARAALLAAAAALCVRCTDTTTASTGAYIPVYGDWTVGYDPLYDPTLDPFYYADPTWTLALSAGASPDTTVPPAQFDDLGTVSDGLVKLNQALAPAFGSLRQLAAGSATDVGGGIQKFAPADLPSGSPFATFRLQARMLGTTRGGWKLEAKPLGAGDDAYT